MVTDLEKLRKITERLPFLGIIKSDEIVRVLVVEDEKSINRLILDTLEYFGCKCASANNSKEAKELIEKESFDVLLANIVLKENSEGSELLRQFQQLFPNSIVIIMSSDEDRISAYSRYFATLAMPFGIYDLVRKVNEGLKSRTK